MTGPQHYRRAEMWRDDAKRHHDPEACMRLATYHATMAAAAASALVAVGQHEAAIQLTDTECSDWITALQLR